jgi:hypothetical protein
MTGWKGPTLPSGGSLISKTLAGGDWLFERAFGRVSPGLAPADGGSLSWADELPAAPSWFAAKAAKSGPASPVPESYIKPDAVIDMTDAPEGSRANAAGYPRNAPWFWRQLLKLHPEYFDAANRSRVRQRLAPEVNETWIKFFPEHQSFVNDKLIHHHIGQGKMAAPLPEPVHQGWSLTLHPNGGG